MDWSSYIIFIANTASKKTWVLIVLWSFFLQRLLCTSINLPYFHAWNTVMTRNTVMTAPCCYLELLDKLQKWLCRTVGPSLAASLETMNHRQNVASLSLFYRYYFGRCSSELAQLVPLLYSRGRCTCYCDKSHNFSVTIPRCYKDVYVNSFFPHMARMWNTIPIECLPLSYDLNGFKSRINISFKYIFPNQISCML